MHAQLQKGDRIAGKYRVLRPIGSGGMGAVYLAQHERLERPVAIKVLHRHLGESSGAVARFEREVRAMALVQHRHVVNALDADVLEDGSPYLVMEYLEGRDLRAECRLRSSIPYAEAVAYVIQACEGIAAVHDVGIIHRDLKPHNLFITNLNAARCVKVLDFGVVKLLAGAEMTLTATDVTVGTPLYMSPEQLCTPNDVSPRSDVWALGVVLWELIAGVSPFAADTPGAVVAAVTLEDPVPLHEMVEGVPAGLSEVVAAALTKSAALRLGSARELAEQLAPFSMPIGEILVATSTPSRRPVLLLERESARPELSAQIRSDVEAFDKTVRPGADRSGPDQLRALPSLARHSIPLTKPASPVAQRFGTSPKEPIVIRMDPMSIGLPSLRSKAAPDPRRELIVGAEAPPSKSGTSRQRLFYGATLSILVLGGVVVMRLQSPKLEVGRDGSTEPTTLAEPMVPPVASVATAAPFGSMSEPGSTASVSTTQGSAPLSRASRRGTSSRSTAAARSALASSAPRAPPTPAPPASAPLAIDGKPLHL